MCYRKEPSKFESYYSSMIPYYACYSSIISAVKVVKAEQSEKRYTTLVC